MSGFRAKRHGKAIKDPKLVPSSSADALRTAMRIEGVPPSDFDDLLWIMAQESVGVPGLPNSLGSSTASGLFQLTEDQRKIFYPHGDQLVGNAVDEARGAITYITDRYGSASAARAFGEKHHWF